MTLQFTQIDPFSGIKPISAQHINLTIFGAAPATVSCSPVAGLSLTQPCGRGKIDEGAILVLPDVLTSCMVGNRDERFFQSHLFFLNQEKRRKNYE